MSRKRQEKRAMGLVAVTRSEIAHGSCPRVVQLARLALPVLLKHFKMIQAAAPAG